MDTIISKETAALIKVLLYQEVAFAQEAGRRDDTNRALDALNEFNRLLDKEFAGL